MDHEIGLPISGTMTQADDQDQDDADAVLQDRKQRLIGGVARLELAGFAVKHRFKSAR